ncbi:LPS export ABC transporter periplasmic protein LptC [Sphingomonas hankyongi]|uniref:LPS export ABC transporter periplasmic protein LptC n=1 Tax=Sphingomonas hankyongi TaxID=2908209 RepID=A0ABT0S4T2_9SPHN|nr:LPS export ABC transporter periplasmic protein LptC [Sphingomonas hankyongi]MCL6730846.1 LPS export ABC transporter periplasmic protein LptC [Sphingomonas hankyongi]
MSEAATRGRIVRQRWAVPGSAHDKLVRWSKVVLPMAVGVLVAILAVAPLGKNGDVSFILDKKKVENAPERMRVEAARYVGADNKGQKFQITANSAIQRSSDIPIVDLRGMLARLAMTQGPLVIAANQGRYNLDTQQIGINGPVRVVGGDGYRLATRDVHVDLKDRRLQSQGPVAGEMRLGEFQASQLKADLDSRTVVLDGRARLKIVQGAVR